LLVVHRTFAPPPILGSLFSFRFFFSFPSLWSVDCCKNTVSYNCHLKVWNVGKAQVR
jgi:hypothetical protein